MAHLTEEEITRSICDYVNENVYNYAVMIDGDWGTGKTYFIREKVIPEVESLKDEKGNYRKAIYFSLYGLKSSDEISEQIYLSFLEYVAGKSEKTISAIKVGARVLLERAGLKGMGVEELLKKFAKFGRSVFFVDDLERCDVPICETLGVLNHLVEQNGFKLIIIANQSEIGKLEYNRNLEFKYLLSLHDGIDFPAIDDSENKNSDSSKKVKINEIRKRTSYLFSENELYEQIKEKLIGRTIYYKPDISLIVPSLVNKCMNITLSSELSTIFCNDIISVLDTEKYFNMRTLQFALIFAQRVRNVIDTKIDNRGTSYELFKLVLSDAIRIAKQNKDGKAMSSWTSGTEYRNFYPDKKNFLNYYITFKFVHDYVYLSSYSEERIVSVLEAYLDEKRKETEKANDPLGVLQTYWELDDSTIESDIHALFINFCNGNYDQKQYNAILHTLFVLKSLGFDNIPVDDIFTKMKDNISNHGGIIVTMRDIVMDNNNPFCFTFNEYKSELKKLAFDHQYRLSKDSLNSYIRTTIGWADSFIDYCIRVNSEFLAKKSFFSSIDMDILIPCLDQSNTKDISDFRRGIMSIYDFSNIGEFYKDDIPNLRLLKDFLAGKEYTEKTKDLNRRLLLQMLDDLIIRLA